MNNTTGHWRRQRGISESKVADLYADAIGALTLCKQGYYRRSRRFPTFALGGIFPPDVAYHGTPAAPRAWMLRRPEFFNLFWYRKVYINRPMFLPLYPTTPPSAFQDGRYCGGQSYREPTQR
jgi:hypothetical protein